MARTPALSLKPGDPAPAFQAPTQTGEVVSLDQFRGRPVVLFFYPKDNTPGCTKEACGFRDEWAALQQAGVVVLGVSIDPVSSHTKFATKFGLPFPLLADTSKAIVSAYGVWEKKSSWAGSTSARTASRFSSVRTVASSRSGTR